MAGSLPARTCRACGAGLAADNRADLCSPCTRRVGISDLCPPTLPAGFWDRPQMRNALQRREFGAVLAAYRSGQDRKITQSDLGLWLGISQGEVSRIERGAVPVRDLDKLDRWARVLGIPQRCLWFTLSEQAPDTCRPRPGTFSVTGEAEGDDVHRRQFLKVAGSGVAAVGTSLVLTGAVSGAPGAPADLFKAVSEADAGSGLFADTPWQRLADSVTRGRSRAGHRRDPGRHPHRVQRRQDPTAHPRHRAPGPGNRHRRPASRTDHRRTRGLTRGISPRGSRCGSRHSPMTGTPGCHRAPAAPPLRARRSCGSPGSTRSARPPDRPRS